MRRILAAGLLTTLFLTACAGSGAPGEPGATGSAGSAGDLSFDVSGVATVDDIAALVPAALKDSGKLVVGASIDYAPAEFRAEDLKTAIGYDVDMAKALAKVTCKKGLAKNIIYLMRSRMIKVFSFKIYLCSIFFTKLFCII